MPNVMTAVRSGDFEAVTTYGIGLAKRTDVDEFTLRRPSRVVVDWVKIYDPHGDTERPKGRTDSVPECLEP